MPRAHDGASDQDPALQGIYWRDEILQLIIGSEGRSVTRRERPVRACREESGGHKGEGAMKIAVAGKGGSGKTTLAGTLARVLGRRGQAVLAIDADTNPNLAITLGLPPSGY
jgi:Mrp family chromosome partitioning ATPase